jgi:hypothetical protein
MGRLRTYPACVQAQCYERTALHVFSRPHFHLLCPPSYLVWRDLSCPFLPTPASRFPTDSGLSAKLLGSLKIFGEEAEILSRTWDCAGAVVAMLAIFSRYPRRHEGQKPSRGSRKQAPKAKCIPTAMWPSLVVGWTHIGQPRATI